MSTGLPLNMSPYVHGFQDNTTSWMSSLINQQDGCIRMVAPQASMGRLRREQLEQTVAKRTPRAPSRTKMMFKTYGINWLTGKLSWNMSGQNEILADKTSLPSPLVKLSSSFPVKPYNRERTLP